MVETASKDGIEFYKAYVKLFSLKPKLYFIGSAEQSTECHEQNNAFENVLVVVFIVGAVLYGFVGAMLATAGLLISLLTVVRREEQ